MGGNYSVFDGVPDLVVVSDSAHRVVYRNPAAVRALGDREDPCCYTEREKRDAAFEKVLRTGEPSELEWTVTANGAHTHYVAQISRVDEGVLCVSRDVTKFKRTEERLRSAEKLMVDTQGVAHLGTWEWDVSQPNATWSAELYRIYGLTPETYTPSYEAYLTMVHDDDRARVIEATNRVFHEHVPYSHDERIFRPDGTMRYLHTWAHPVLDETGKLTHLIGVCQDITDRALAELELEQRVSERTAQLESALRDLEAFNGMASHDLRAPLTVMQLVVDVWAKDPDRSKERAATYLDRMQRAVRTMADLLDGLLGFARIGEAAIRPVEVDVSALAAELASELRATAPERVASFEIAPELRVQADPALFRVVLSNLLGNAWKYSQRKPSTKIEVGRAGERLVIRDNGIGFDMREYSDLFAPFKRLASAREFTGSGIGLATVQRIVERHGGAITAESRPDEGSAFFIHLPVLR